MIIRNNTGGRRTARYLGTAQTAIGKTLEKLSSGYQINRSADDAAGLAISEKMRLNMTGLSRARLNSIEGSRLIQTGEGALQEIQDLLDRAEYLATQSANGTYADKLDRENLQKELDHICSEIDRISKEAKFNTIELFQDVGLEGERTFPEGSDPRRQLAVTAGQVNREATASTVEKKRPALSSNVQLDALLEGQEKGRLNIVYIEDKAVNANPAGNGGSPASHGVTDSATGTPVDLNQILQTEIVPNAVQGILTNYPAFSYLDGSSIGIGLHYYEDSNSTTLAAVALESSLYSHGKGGQLTYQLRINTATIKNWDGDVRQNLEATISHEMIHAFMDEAATSGMVGQPVTGGTSTQDNAEKFPDWFREGMAQTASGPDTWVKMPATETTPGGTVITTYGGLQIDKNSTAAGIRGEIQRFRLGSGSTASQYGTGYLACMYLGAVIASGSDNPSAVSASVISEGLRQLMNGVIGGKSLDKAIRDLSNNHFSGLDSFVSKFNDAGTEVCSFVTNLLTATGSGRGGLICGDLTAANILPDNAINDLKLFKLDVQNQKVTNTYPNDYQTASGGAAKADGTAPTGFSQGTAAYQDYGRLRVYGITDPSQIAYDSISKKLTINAGNGIKITMQGADTSQPVQGLVLGDASGANPLSVELDRVDLSGMNSPSLSIHGNTKINYEGKNSLGSVTVDGTVDFTGTGQLKAASFTDSGSSTVNFHGGAVIAGNGTGSITAGTVTVDGTAMAAALNPEPAGQKSIDIDWTKLSGLRDIASIEIDGGKSEMLLDGTQSAKLWLNSTSPSQQVTFTDSTGKSKTLIAAIQNGTFCWEELSGPFVVTGGIKGTDYHYDGNTLVIDRADAQLTVKDAANVSGTRNIRIADNVSGKVQLKLDGVTCSPASGCAFDLGEGNNVELTLADGAANTFKSGSGYAGIALGDGTNLTITGSTAGVLNAAGGNMGAGIGRSNGSSTDSQSTITINGGTIQAIGGTYAAGIGASMQSSMGDIKIAGGNITAHGGRGGAGVGGAGDFSSKSTQLGNVRDITITGGTIVADSVEHGAGIGGGWGTLNQRTKVRNIEITGGKIAASCPNHGTGIGAGCYGEVENVIIGGTAHITKAQGGDYGAGIGSSFNGKCGAIKIADDAQIDLAQGGTGGAGIGSGGGWNFNPNITNIGSEVGNIDIDTTKVVVAQGGMDGVGIGSGYDKRIKSTCGNITITQGTITATGGANSTGIGAGRNSTSGSITIGSDDDTKQVVVTAAGGMTNDGGNILAFSDQDHNNPNLIRITGTNTTVRPGAAGEGLNSTSGVPVDPNTPPGNIAGLPDNKKLYSYPVYMLETTPEPEVAAGLKDLNVGLPLPAGTDLSRVTISAKPKDASSSWAGQTWKVGLTHSAPYDGLAYIWMSGENQTLTIDDGSGNPFTVDLVFHPDSGKFRVQAQKKPDPVQPPGYDPTPKPDPGPDPDPKPDPKPEPGPDTKPEPKPEPIPPEPEPPQPKGPGGIILQIGANYGEILEVPRFYLSAKALELNRVDISTQQNALDSMPVLRDAINRVSSIRGEYGALQNRLDHNQNDLSQAAENLTDAESRIRDADMAEEYTKLVKLNILQQSAQAMLAHSNQEASRVMQLFQ